MTLSTYSFALFCWVRFLPNSRASRIQLIEVNRTQNGFEESCSLRLGDPAEGYHYSDSCIALKCSGRKRDDFLD